MKLRKRIASVSRRNQPRMAKYNRRVKAWKQEQGNTRCGFPECSKPTDDCHHLCGKGKTQQGDLLLFEQLWFPVCREHHNWIGANPDASRLHGLTPPIGMWNTMPPVRLVPMPDADWDEPMIRNGIVFSWILCGDRVYEMSQLRHEWTTEHLVDYMLATDPGAAAFLLRSGIEVPDEILKRHETKNI